MGYSENDVISEDCEKTNLSSGTPTSPLSLSDIGLASKRPSSLAPNYMLQSDRQQSDNDSNPYEVMDIIGQFYSFGPIEMAKEILQYLGPKDLFSCLLVCKTWYNGISEDMKSVLGLTGKIQRKRKRSPALSQNGIASLSRFCKRQAVFGVKVDLNQPLSVPFTTPAPSDPYNFPVLKRRACPNCRGFAKILNMRRAECTTCNFDFCSHCFMRYHGGPCLLSRSEIGKDNEDEGPNDNIFIVGKKTRVVKKRLKRL